MEPVCGIMRGNVEIKGVGLDIRETESSRKSSLELLYIYITRHELWLFPGLQTLIFTISLSFVLLPAHWALAYEHTRKSILNRECGNI